MTTRNQVIFGEQMLAAARKEFRRSRGMDYDGPTFKEFAETPLVAARLAFEGEWDSIASVDDPATREIILGASGIFGPFSFKAEKIGEHQVEIVEFTYHGAEYWQLIESDPDD